MTMQRIGVQLRRLGGSPRLKSQVVIFVPIGEESLHIPMNPGMRVMRKVSATGTEILKQVLHPLRVL